MFLYLKILHFTLDDIDKFLLNEVLRNSWSFKQIWFKIWFSQWILSLDQCAQILSASNRNPRLFVSKLSLMHMCSCREFRRRRFKLKNRSRVFHISTLEGLKFSKNNTWRSKKTACHHVPIYRITLNFNLPSK